jgi:tetratricopeptide (TPR) repeat protein
MKMEKKMEEYFLRAFKLDPEDFLPIYRLCDYYFYHKKFDKINQVLEMAGFDQKKPDNFLLLRVLVFVALAEGNYQKALSLYAGAISRHPQDAAMHKGYALSLLLLKERKAADRYFKKAEELMLNQTLSATRHNLNQIKKIVERSGATFVAMQYPMRSVQSLQDIYSDEESVIYVDNEEIFKTALYEESWNDYSVDNFAHDFGHCTEKGNRLIAWNVARTLCRTYFKERY